MTSSRTATSTNPPLYRDVLEQIHWHLLPRTYIEIGVFGGASLRRTAPGTRILGIDPDPQLTVALPDNATILDVTSDDFFARPDVDDLLGGLPVDLAFVDGMHHFEFALRDFMHLERLASPDSTVLVHDCLPIDAETATRDRATAVWSGDVWKVILCLKEYRPDLRVTTLDAAPTGLGVIQGLDPTSTVLDEAYDEIIARYVDLPFEVLDDKHRQLNVEPVTAETISTLWPRRPTRRRTPAMYARHYGSAAVRKSEALVKRTPLKALVGPFVRRLRHTGG